MKALTTLTANRRSEYDLQIRRWLMGAEHPLHPTQMLSGAEESAGWWTKYHSFYWFILSDAVQLVNLWHSRLNRKDKNIVFEETLIWIFDETPSTWPCTMENICGTLRMNPAVIRETVGMVLLGVIMPPRQAHSTVTKRMAYEGYNSERRVNAQPERDRTRR